MGWKYEISIWTKQVSGEYRYETYYEGNRLMKVVSDLWTLHKIGRVVRLVIR